MQVLKEGVEYVLSNFNSDQKQRIIFTEKVKGVFNKGTTNEEVITMLIDRFYALQKKNFSAENQCVILLLKNIRQLLAKRLTKKINQVNKITNGQAEQQYIETTNFDER